MQKRKMFLQSYRKQTLEQHDHLVVKLNGPSVDLFDFELAFEHWYSKE
jgi:hypothetical protein